MKVILHAGMHKTGSSSIQDTFFRWKGTEITYLPVPNANHGVWCKRQFDADPAADAARAAGFAGLEKFLADETPDTLLISAEAMSLSNTGERHRRFAAYFGNAESIDVYAYVRPPVGLKSSNYQQRLKMRPLAVVNNPETTTDYRPRFRPMDDVYGGGHVHLRPFVRHALRDGDVVRDFAARIGVDLPVARIVRSNESLSLPASALLYMERIYGSAYRTGYPGAGQENAGFVELLATVGGPRFILGPVIAGPILDRSHDDIRWMEDRLGCRLEEALSGDAVAINAYGEFASHGLEAAVRHLPDLVQRRASLAPAHRDALFKGLDRYAAMPGIDTLAAALDALRDSFNRTPERRGSIL